MRFFTSYVMLVCVWGMTQVGAAAPPSNTGDGFVAQQRGYCEIIAPTHNLGVVTELKEVCVHAVPTIFAQLGSDADELSAPPVRVVVVQHPEEMVNFVPDGARIPSWSGAVAFPSHHLVLLPLLRRNGGPVDDLPITLAHEVSHVAFEQIAGTAYTPRWFSEGIAILQSEGSSFHRKRSIWWASLFNRIEPLSAIEQYPEGAKAAEQAYAQAADFMAFLVEREGWNGIKLLLTHLQDGMTFDKAFYQTYGTSVRVLELEWNEQLFGGLGWVMSVTSDTVWLGLGALICIVGFFVVRRRKHARLKEMGEEEAQLEQAIGALDHAMDHAPGQMNIEKPTIVRGNAPLSATPVMDRIKKQRIKVEVEGKIHTLH